MGIAVLAMKASVIEMFLVWLLIGTSGTKEVTKKSKKPKFSVPQINCDVKAGKIINPEFIAKCPAGCQDPKYHVYGTDIYASYSSVCGAAVHSGVVDNSGGKILVRKVAGQSGYKGSYSNGIRSLSLPRWRESFIISEGKQKRGMTYPSTLEYSSPKSSVAKADETTKPYQKSTVLLSTTLLPTTTTRVLATTPAGPLSTTPKPRTPLDTTTTTSTFTITARLQPGGHRTRDTGFRSTAAYVGNHSIARAHTGMAPCGAILSGFVDGTALADLSYVEEASGKQQLVLTLLPTSGQFTLLQLAASLMKVTSSRNDVSSSVCCKAGEAGSWKPGLALLDAGSKPNEELKTRSLEPVSKGDPNCKVDLSFLIDGSWSIGKRRFRIQKQFLKDVSQALDIGPAGPLLGIVQYGDDPSMEFNLKTHVDSRDLKAAIEKISQKGGLSNVGRALSFVTKNFFSNANGNRGGAPNVAIVMVDGWPTDKVEEASRLARESGINIFFITIEGAVENEKQNVIEPNFVNKAVCRQNGFYSLNVLSWFSLHKIVQPLVKRVCDTNRLACSKTCLNSADIGFVIDGSSSVGTGNFRTLLQFVANLSKEFEISDTDTRIGAVQYTYEQRLEFGFDKYSTKQDILNAIKRVNYWSGGTSTGAAINYALEHLFKKSKPNKRKLMILITDGRSYDDVRVPAMAAHQNGVITYSVGIAWAAQDELEVIATHPTKDHSFFVDEFDDLYRSVPKIIQNICTEFNSQPRN